MTRIRVLTTTTTTTNATSNASELDKHPLCNSIQLFTTIERFLRSLIGGGVLGCVLGLGLGILSNAGELLN